jgi:pimeloyl-ACP methyl ester carboxylesterase
MAARGFNQQTMTIYMFPGQGADYRQFKNLTLDERFATVFIHYPVPHKGSDMREYACQLLDQIDTSRSVILLGVSLGGMLCTELTDLIHPERTIIISSAKCRSELPSRYQFMQDYPVYKALPKNLIKAGSLIAQPLFEPDRKHGKATFKAMLRDKDPAFLKRTISMIVNWDRISFSDQIVHIHGNNDHTLPLKKVSAQYIIKDGSHMMVFTRAAEISAIVNHILSSIE